MGYTHYYYQAQHMDPERFARFSQDIHVMLSKADIPLTYLEEQEEGRWDDSDGFIANNEMVHFNGKGEDSHETFMILLNKEPQEWQSPRDDGLIFECTKTAYKPYDKYVVAALILAKIHFEDDIAISSDGEFPEDHLEGLAIVNSLFDYDVSFGDIVTHDEEKGSWVYMNNNIIVGQNPYTAVTMDEFEKAIDNI